MIKKILIAITVFVIILGAVYLINIKKDNRLDDDSRLEKKITEDIADIELPETDKDLAEEETEEIIKVNKKIVEEALVKNDPEKTLIQCLADGGLVIYGSRTCPACAQLAESFGGYDKIALIYVECSEEWERCSAEMQTNYVPEIQIQGKLYNGPRNPENIADAVSCNI